MIGFRGRVEKMGEQFLLHYLEEYLTIDPVCTGELDEGMLVEIVSARGGFIIVKPIRFV